MNVLVLGGNGFIGSHVCEQLVARREHHLRVYARRPPRYDVSAEWFIGDLHDSAKLAEALIGMDVVVHCVSSTVPATSSTDPISDIQANLVGTVALLGLMREVGVRRLVYLSSGGTVYGNPKVSPVRETHPLDPISSYGAVKVAVEKFIGVAQHAWGLRPIIFRPSNPYGERQGHGGVQGLIATALQNAMRSIPTNIYGDGSSIRDYIYVKDLAALIVSGTESEVCGVFNAGSGQGHSVAEIVRILEAATGLTVPIRRLEARKFDVKEIVLDNRAARVVFNWEPATSIEVGVRSYFEWLLKQPWIPI